MSQFRQSATAPQLRHEQTELLLAAAGPLRSPLRRIVSDVLLAARGGAISGSLARTGNVFLFKAFNLRRQPTAVPGPGSNSGDDCQAGCALPLPASNIGHCQAPSAPVGSRLLRRPSRSPVTFPIDVRQTGCHSCGRSNEGSRLMADTDRCCGRGRADCALAGASSQEASRSSRDPVGGS